MASDIAARIAAVEQRYGLVMGRAFPASSRNCVARCVAADGAARVVKLTGSDAEALAEVAALRAFGGRGAVRLLQHDAELGALILERLGADVTSLEDAPATAAAARLYPVLHAAPIPAAAIPLRRWFRALWARGDAHAPGIVARAEGLLRTAPRSVLLHGDLHPGNLLVRADAWVAIDPKGLVGDPAFDGVQWLANRVDPGRAVAQARERAAVLAAGIGCSAERVLAWAEVQAVLSVCWAEEDGEDPEWWRAHAAVLRRAGG